MLEADIEALVAAGASADRDAARTAFAALRDALSAGTVRAAEPDSSSPVGWRVNTWVKQGILLGFRFGDMVDVSMDHGRWPFYDKDTLPIKRPGLAALVRIVPGGSAVRDGAYLAPGVICMPPMYVNIGAWVGEQSLIDSHALVGRARRWARACTSARRADRRRHRTGRRHAGHHRRRSAHRRQHRNLRGRHHQGARGHRRGHGPDRLDPCVRPRARRSDQANGRAAPRRAGRRRGRARCPRGDHRQGSRVGALARDTGDREVRDSRTDTRRSSRRGFGKSRAPGGGRSRRADARAGRHRFHDRPGNGSRPVAGAVSARDRIRGHRAAGR